MKKLHQYRKTMCESEDCRSSSKLNLHPEWSCILISPQFVWRGDHVIHPASPIPSWSELLPEMLSWILSPEFTRCVFCALNNPQNIDDTTAEPGKNMPIRTRELNLFTKTIIEARIAFAPVDILSHLYGEYFTTRNNWIQAHNLELTVCLYWQDRREPEHLLHIAETLKPNCAIFTGSSKPRAMAKGQEKSSMCVCLCIGVTPGLRVWWLASKIDADLNSCPLSWHTHLSVLWKADHQERAPARRHL